MQPNARAALVGATVDLGIYYPTASSLYYSYGNAVVSASTVEYVGSSANFQWEVDITDTQIKFTNIGGNKSLSTASFNGWVFSVLSGATMIGASADSSSGFLPVGINLVGNQLYVDYSGVFVAGGASSVINIQTAVVPEPSTVLAGALLLVPLGLGAMRKIRQ